MRKVVFGILCTADGLCSHTDGIGDEGLHAYFTDLLLYGRVTYELMVPFWPDVARDQSMSETSNEFARVFDSLDMLVFSRTLSQVEAGARSTKIQRDDVRDVAAPGIVDHQNSGRVRMRPHEQVRDPGIDILR